MKKYNINENNFIIVKGGHLIGNSNDEIYFIIAIDYEYCFYYFVYGVIYNEIDNDKYRFVISGVYDCCFVYFLLMFMIKGMIMKLGLLL